MSRHLNLLSIQMRRALLVLLALVLLAAPGLAYASTDTNLRVVPNFNWYTIYGGVFTDTAVSMVRDSSGNIYVTGSTYHGWKNVPISPLRAHIDGRSPTRGFPLTNAYVAKFNSDGALLWYTFYGTSQAYTTGNSILLDASGNLYIVGTSNGNWDGLTARTPFHGISWGPDEKSNDDVYILKLNSAGAYQWHTYYGSTKEDAISAAAFDSSNNILIVGSTESTWTGLTPINPFSGSMDFFALSIDKQGAYQWHTFYGMESGRVSISDMQFDSTGNIFLSGTSSNVFSGISPLHPRSSAEDEVLVMKLSKSGALQWYTLYGGLSYDGGGGLIIKGSDLYISGTARDGWPGLVPLHPAKKDVYNLFVLKLNNAGAHQWHTFYGDASGSDLVMDNRGILYATGSVWDMDINPVNPTATGRGVLLMALNEQGQYVSHADYGYGSGSELILDGNTLYVFGGAEANWPDGDPLHPFYNNHDIVLAKFTIVDKPTYATATSLTLPPNPVELGRPTALTANIGSAGDVPSSGIVTFKDGDTVIGSVHVVNGAATLNITPSVIGSHAITAQYTGGPGFLPSQTTQAAIQWVVKAKTEVLVDYYIDHSEYGENVFFGVQVRPVNNNIYPITGTVVLKAGTRVIASAPVKDGRAYIETNSLPTGTSSITFTYLGDDIFASSVSPASPYHVIKAHTYSQLFALPSDTIRYGDYLTVRVKVSCSYFATAIPDGTVTIEANDKVLASPPLVNGIALFHTYTLLPGTYLLKATYPGTNNFEEAYPSAQNITITQGVPQILLSAEGGNPTAGGEERRINITVSGAYPDMIQPTGTVTLYEGETEIATLTLVDGLAVSEPITLSEGVHTFTAKYNGDALYLSETSQPAAVIVAGTPIYLPVMVR